MYANKRPEQGEHSEQCFPAEHTLITPTPLYAQKVQDCKGGLGIWDSKVALTSLQFLSSTE